MSTTTVSYSLDQNTIQGIEELAKEKSFSKSDAVREIYRLYALQQSLGQLQDKASPLARKLGVQREDDVEQIFG